MHNPELHSLAGINWQFFCTFTFARERVPVGVRASMFFALLRKQACNSGVHFKQLLWCLRTERGEQFGRIHFHAVIAGFPASFVNKPTCFATAKLWESLGGGFAKVSIYSQALDGLDYILKPEDTESQHSRYAGDYHELTKFGGSCDVTLSESLLPVVMGRRGYRKDTASSTTQGAVSNPHPSRKVNPTTKAYDTSAHLASASSQPIRAVNVREGAISRSQGPGSSASK